MKNVMFSPFLAHNVLIFEISFPSFCAKKAESFLTGDFEYILKRGNKNREQQRIIGS
jgi:hypothetical protein